MRTTTRTPILVTGAALLVLGLSACGGSTSGASAASGSAVGASSSAGTGAGTGTGQGDFSAYRDCMSTNGVTMPDVGGPGGIGTPPSGMPTTPPSGLPSGAPAAGGPGGFPLPEGVDQATFDKAQKACASLQPAFGPGRSGQIDRTALAAFTSCLGDHDVTVPAGEDAMRQLDRTDPKVASALKTCAPLLPQPGAVGTGASASASAS